MDFSTGRSNWMFPGFVWGWMRSTGRDWLSTGIEAFSFPCHLFFPSVCPPSAFVLPCVLFRGCSPFLNKAVSPPMCSPTSSRSQTHAHAATVPCSCQTAKLSLPPDQNRSRLSLRISLSLSLFPSLSLFSLFLVFSHPPTLLFPSPSWPPQCHLTVVSCHGDLRGAT